MELTTNYQSPNSSNTVHLLSYYRARSTHNTLRSSQKSDPQHNTTQHKVVVKDRPHEEPKTRRRQHDTKGKNKKKKKETSDYQPHAAATTAILLGHETDGIHNASHRKTKE